MTSNYAANSGHSPDAHDARTIETGSQPRPAGCGRTETLGLVAFVISSHDFYNGDVPEPGRQRIEAEYALQQQGMGGELLLHLGLIDGKPDTEQRRIARQACIYAQLLCFFFLLFGTLLLRLFDVPLSMVKVVGGVILTRVGFELFNPPASGGRAWSRSSAG